MSFIVALIGGVLTFLSPCILPLVPVYIAYITGISVQDLKNKESQKNLIVALSNSLAFVLGFALIFSVLSFFLFILSMGMGNLKIWLSRIGGIVIILFGLNMTGILKLNFLNFQFRPEIKGKINSLPGSFLMGLAFGGGWTPCVGPVLSGILLLSSSTDKLYLAILHLIVYSLGIGIPFVFTALFLSSIVNLLDFLKKNSRLTELISGIFLIFLGILISFNLTGFIANFLSKIFPFLLDLEYKLIK